MKKDEYRFRIAGFGVALRLPDGCRTERLLPSFQPFTAADWTESMRVMSCDVAMQTGGDARPIDGRLLEQTVNDMGTIRLYDRADAYVVTLSDRCETMMHRMTACRDFSEVRIDLCRDDRGVGSGLSSLLRIAYSQAVLSHDAVAIHASAVFREQTAYLFLGQSGAGKSTHASLWIRHLPGTELLNDDNPTIRLVDGCFRACGTPWSGKTPCYRPLDFPIGGIVRLSQAARNRFCRQEGTDAFVTLYPGCSVIAQDDVLWGRLCDTLIRLAESVPVGQLACRPDADAARLCCESLHDIRMN